MIFGICHGFEDSYSVFEFDPSEFAEYDNGLDYDDGLQDSLDDLQFIGDRGGQCSGDCELTCTGDQAVNLTKGIPVTFCSDGYGNSKYKPNTQCKLDISTQKDTWVKMTFCDFNVHYTTGCREDKLVLLDRGTEIEYVEEPPCMRKVQQIKRFCGTQTSGKRYLIRTPFARLKFVANKDSNTRRGFKVLLEAVDSPCAFNLDGNSGKIKIKKIVNGKYVPNYYCRWCYGDSNVVTDALHINCSSFSINTAKNTAKVDADCMHICSADSRLSYTGKNGPQYSSTGGPVDIQFFSNSRLVDTGFECDYKVYQAGAPGDTCLHPNNCQKRLECSSQNKCVCKAAYDEIDYNGQEVCAINSLHLGSSCIEPYDCSNSVANSTCSGSICSCLSGFVDANGQCLPAKDLGESCQENEQCTTANAECSGGTCSCESGFVASSGQCLATKTLGQSCQANVQCITSNAECSSGTCSCKSGFVASGGQCLAEKTIGQSCSVTLQCVTANTECSGGTCKCKSGWSQPGSCGQGTNSDTCYPAIVLDTTNVATLSSNIPSSPVKLCLTRFSTGYIEFIKGNKKVRYQWTASSGTDNLTVRKFAGGGYSLVHKKSWATNVNPDVLQQRKANDKAQLRNIAGTTIISSFVYNPPNSWTSIKFQRTNPTSGTTKLIIIN